MHSMQLPTIVQLHHHNHHLQLCYNRVQYNNSSKHSNNDN